MTKTGIHRGRDARGEAFANPLKVSRPFPWLLLLSYRFLAGLTEFAENNQLKASHFTAIGAFHEALFG